VEARPSGDGSIPGHIVDGDSFTGSKVALQIISVGPDWHMGGSQRGSFAVCS
jgi:hypothetical protein